MCLFISFVFYEKKQCTFANENEKQINMAKNRNILLTLTIESPIVLVASMVAFHLRESVVMPMEVSALHIGGDLCLLKDCINSLSAYYQKRGLEQQCVPMKVRATEDKYNVEDSNIQKQRMELFHQEYQYEQQQYMQRKKKPMKRNFRLY